MKFKTHNDKEIMCGGCFQGEILTSYKNLVKLFGEPTIADGYKVDAEWLIEFEDGTIAAIYNWKDGKNYNGHNGTATEDIKDWHIGGNDQKAVVYVTEVVKGINKKG